MKISRNTLYIILSIIISLILISCSKQKTGNTKAAIASIEITPSALLLEDQGSSANLTVKAYDNKGNEIDLTGEALEWQNSDPATLSVTPNSDAISASVTAQNPLGSSVISVRLKGENELLSAPVGVTIAKPKDGVKLIQDSSVVFPPVDIPVFATLENFTSEHIDTSGSEAKIGSFSLTEVGSKFKENNGNLHYPIVLVDKTVSVDDLVLADGGAAIAGKVLNVETKGRYTLAQVELVSLTDLFDKLRVSYDSEKLIQSGVATPQSLFDNNPESASQLETLATECKVSGSFAAASISLPAPSVTLTPIVDGRVDIENDIYMFKTGLKGKVVVEPGFNIQPGATGTLTCELGQAKEIDFPIPLGPLAVAISGKIKIQPVFEASGSFAAGPRLGGKGTAGLELEVQVGFDTSANNPNLSKATAKPILTNNLVTDKSSEDQTFTVSIGAFETAAIGLQVGGKVLSAANKLTSWIAFDKLKAFVDDLTKSLFITILNGKVGPIGKVVWDSPKRVINNESSSSTIGLDALGQVSLGGDGLKELMTYFKGGLIVDLTLAKITFNLGTLHRVFEKDTITAASNCFNGPVNNETVVCVREGEAVGFQVRVKYVTGPIMIGPDTVLSRGELWLSKDKKLADMSIIPSGNLMTIATTVTKEMCQTGAVSFLAYNNMVWKLETAGFAGKVKLKCEGDENGVPLAVSDEVTTPKNTAKTIDVLSNDTDPNNDPLTLDSVTSPNNGTARISSQKAIYTPKDGFVGSDSFNYTISDSKGARATGTVFVTVQGQIASTCSEFRGTYRFMPNNLVYIDPSTHRPFVGEPLNSYVTMTFTDIAVTSNAAPPFINVSGQNLVTGNSGYCNFSATGRGTAAGRPNVTASFNGELNPTSMEIMGQLSYGNNGEFPGGQPYKITFEGMLEPPPQ